MQLLLLEWRIVMQLTSRQHTTNKQPFLHFASSLPDPLHIGTLYIAHICIRYMYIFEKRYFVECDNIR